MAVADVDVDESDDEWKRALLYTKEECDFCDQMATEHNPALAELLQRHGAFLCKDHHRIALHEQNLGHLSDGNPVGLSAGGTHDTPVSEAFLSSAESDSENYDDIRTIVIDTDGDVYQALEADDGVILVGNDTLRRPDWKRFRTLAGLYDEWKVVHIPAEHLDRLEEEERYCPPDDFEEPEHTREEAEEAVAGTW